MSNLERILMEHASVGWSECGKWIARTFAAMSAWLVTWMCLIFVIWHSGNISYGWLMPLPVLVHLITEPLFMKREEKIFGKASE